MKKIIVITASLFIMGTAALYAEKLADSPVQIKSEGEKLVNLNSSSGQLNQLERRIDALERQIRDQNTAMRNLERDLSDLRRRR